MGSTLTALAEGFVFACVDEYFVRTDALIVAIKAIYTSYDLRGSRLGGRAAGMGAREILLHATSGIDVGRVKSAIERMGFEAVGGSYVARLG